MSSLASPRKSEVLSPTLSEHLKRLKSLDIYRDIPKDLTQQTTTGALLSLLCTGFITYLVLSSLSSYLSIDYDHSMFIERPLMIHPYSNSAKLVESTILNGMGMISTTKSESSPSDHLLSFSLLPLHYNLTLFSIPCPLVHMEAHDVLGTAITPLRSETRKIRTDNQGKWKTGPNGQPLTTGQIENGDGGEAEVGEGCNVAGHIMVKKVPGALLLALLGFQELIHRFIPSGRFNMSHVIHDVWFGEEHHMELFSAITNARISPLSGAKRITKPDSPGSEMEGGVSYEYFMKVVPTQLLTSSGVRHDSYQYVANSNEIHGQFVQPKIFFRYEIEAMSVRFTEKNKKFSHLLVELCAIIGGVFSMLGMLSRIVLSFSRWMGWEKKEEEVKVSGRAEGAGGMPLHQHLQGNRYQ